MGILDFSSASEGEDGDEEGQGGGGRRKRRVPEQGPAPGGPARPLSLLQHGFSRVLQGGVAGPGRGRGDGGDSQEEFGGRDDDPPLRRPAADSRQRRDWTISSDSDGEGEGGAAGLDQRGRPDARGTPPSSSSLKGAHGGASSQSYECPEPPPSRAGVPKRTSRRVDHDSHESGCIELLEPAGRQRGAAATKRSAARVRFRKSPDIQSFSSSEDDLPAKEPRPGRERGDRRGEFTRLKSRRPDPSPWQRSRDQAAAGAIDRLLGNLLILGSLPCTEWQWMTEHLPNIKSHVLYLWRFIQ